jgi:hypothetical protein
MGGTAMKNIYAQFFFDPAWRQSSMPNPHTWRTASYSQDKKNVAEQEEIFKKKLEKQGFPIHSICEKFNQEFAPPPPKQASGWPGSYGARDMISVALGSPEPRWTDGNWWHEREHYPLSADMKKSDIDGLAVTDWGKIPEVGNMLTSRRSWLAEHPVDSPSLVGAFQYFIPGHGYGLFIGYPSFVDLGVYLMGMTEFLTLLALDPDMADHFMNKCFELSTSYIDFLLKEQPETFGILGGFGGDTTCMLSPDLYTRFGSAWDRRLLSHVRGKHGIPDDLPCNLHSCGVSNHLYANWSVHPCRENIAIMQTRLIPGTVGELRKSLPQAYLELTIHPPQFDLTRASHEGIKKILETSMGDATENTILKLYFVATDENALEQTMQAMKTSADTLRACLS